MFFGVSETQVPRWWSSAKGKLQCWKLVVFSLAEMILAEGGKALFLQGKITLERTTELCFSTTVPMNIHVSTNFAYSVERKWKRQFLFHLVIVLPTCTWKCHKNFYSADIATAGGCSKESGTLTFFQVGKQWHFRGLIRVIGIFLNLCDCSAYLHWYILRVGAVKLNKINKT